MAISELLRNKLIITYRLQPQYASTLASLLVNEMATYATLAGFMRRHDDSSGEERDRDAAVKAFVSRMRRYRPFTDGAKIHNASNIGYYLDNETKRKIFDEIKEPANVHIAG